MEIPAYIGGPLIIVGSIALGIALSILLEPWIGTKGS